MCVCVCVCVCVCMCVCVCVCDCVCVRVLYQVGSVCACQNTKEHIIMCAMSHHMHADRSHNQGVVLAVQEF